MNRKFFILLISIFYFFSCSENTTEGQTENSSIELLSYYGTYLYEDNDCGGQDIQYATIDTNGIVFFDLLSDGCDDTVECYSRNPYDLIEISPDTFLVSSLENSTEIYIPFEKKMFKGHFIPHFWIC